MSTPQPPPRFDCFSSTAGPVMTPRPILISPVAQGKPENYGIVRSLGIIFTGQFLPENSAYVQ